MTLPATGNVFRGRLAAKPEKHKQHLWQCRD